VILLHVVSEELFASLGEAGESYPVDQILEDRRSEMEELCSQRVRPRLGNRGAVRQIVALGSPFLKILQTAQEEGVDLIVMSTHGRTGLSHLLIGSITERVVRQAGCPVLSVRPRALTASVQ
jgi:nucleotide-binding universal stress UspA family protein